MLKPENKLGLRTKVYGKPGNVSTYIDVKQGKRFLVEPLPVPTVKPTLLQRMFGWLK